MAPTERASQMAASPGLPRVTILTADAGGGHRAAAASIAEALEGRACTSFLSLMDHYAPFPMNTWSADYSRWVNYAPWFYQLIYRWGASRARVVRTERAVYPFLREHVARGLQAAEVDLFISVHPLHTDIPLWSLSETGRRARFVTVVTDPVTPPVAWFCPDVDLCVVATEQARAVAIACGMRPDKVRIIGLPIRRAFGAARGRSKPEARAALELDPGRPLLLLAGGGAGIGRLLPLSHAIVEQLVRLAAPVQMAIIAGQNRALHGRLSAERWPLPVRVLGFVHNMADWLAAADLLVTKAGPGTLAEAACMGLPTVICDFVPGQEAGNVRWIEQNGAGVFEPGAAGVAAAAAELLHPDNPSLREMARCARAIARPAAAREIVAAALALLQQQDAPATMQEAIPAI